MKMKSGSKTKSVNGYKQIDVSYLIVFHVHDALIY